MKRHLLLLPALTAFALFSTSLVGQEAAHDHANLYPPADIKWKDGPASLPAGAKVAILEGDPSKEGMFVIRLRVPDGYHIPAHTHPKPERVTVIQGTFKLAMGDKLKMSDAQILPAGTYGIWPPGMVHAAWVDGETIVQLHGMGPWVINYVNPADDPRNKKKAE